MYEHILLNIYKTLSNRPQLNKVFKHLRNKFENKLNVSLNSMSFCLYFKKKRTIFILVLI